MRPRIQKYIELVLDGIFDNIDLTEIKTSVELNDALSNMMGNAGWGEKIKDEFFYGDNGFRDTLEAELKKVWLKEKGESMKEAKETEIVDLMGATEKVLKNMKEFSDNARKEADDKMIKPEKYWAHMMQAIKDEAKITDQALLVAGAPVALVMDVIGEVAGTELQYKRVILSKDDGTTQEVPVEEFSAKIAPYTKQFTSPMEALVMGDPASILKVVQKVYGKDVAQWSAPAEKQEAAMPYLSALALMEVYNLIKFEKESSLFEMVEGVLTIKEDAAKLLHDAFDKEDSEYVVDLFPHVLPEYPKMLVQEAKTVLNTLSDDEVSKLFPNIQPEYLSNLKESELKELATKFAEGCGKTHGEKPKKSFGGPAKKGATLKGKVGKGKKVGEGAEDGNPEVYQDITFTLALHDITPDAHAEIMRMVNELSTDINTYTYELGRKGASDDLSPEALAYVNKVTGK